MKKPEGDFKCLQCHEVWRGNELKIRTDSNSQRLVCGDYFCGGIVVRFEMRPKQADSQIAVRGE